ncbi:putative protein arginine N-methyltransferase 5 [Glarea lozoyensis 74030]|uniref:Protein arginine N-methyltransferase n=1 Tax=Glarea lozoyensis (strain ATCC 74030 / MF5533) TaxID=1104152 RepID=H0ER30_GLAL7|nr:putative protein arginine N-methyltransferase 5 [Glarea lozoyensis 74030]
MSASPTPAESADHTTKQKSKSKDSAAHLIYMRYLQRNQPPRTAIEKFGSGYQDYLQAPLQPLTDNLESVTYEVFEKDPVKYDWYERAIEEALSDWASQKKPTSNLNGSVVIAVAGSGRGPLVTRALKASQTTGVAVEVWAVEKNPNAALNAYSGASTTFGYFSKGYHRYNCNRDSAWEFTHPLPASTLAIAEARRSGGVSGGGGGSMAGGDGANEHNTRYSRLNFVCKDRGVVNGIAGYFEAVLYDGGENGKVELSTRPDTIDAKSKDMISWFPIFFPLKVSCLCNIFDEFRLFQYLPSVQNPLYFPDDSELEISVWRQTDDRKVWYEWLVEAFVMVGPNKRMRLGMSEVGSSRKVGCLM